MVAATEVAAVVVAVSVVVVAVAAVVVAVDEPSDWEVGAGLCC